jgi:hypothetical protein
MSTNSAALSANVSSSQKPVIWIREDGVTSSGERQPRYSPHDTAASTAETPRTSAGR